jgi:hypothetical protein
VAQYYLVLPVHALIFFAEIPEPFVQLEVFLLVLALWLVDCKIRLADFQLDLEVQVVPVLVRQG